jgi:AcrR family transcriptional regulator
MPTAQDTTRATAPHRGRPRDPARDARILEAVGSLIAEVGYDRMTVDAIAERAGVSKPTIYRRWAGKPEIVAEAIRSHKEQGPLPDTGSLRGDLLAVARELGQSLSGNNAQVAAGLTGLLRSSDEFATLFREHVIDVGRERYRPLLERAAARGEIADAAAVTPLFADIAGALVFSRALISREPVDDAFTAELVDRVLLPVLAPGPLTETER